ncbi:MAG: DUF6505 family protein [Hyphomicrobium aestuarii]|nr:DUF6505 family protein [Hyphomicrobium aestuarii]
MRQLLRTIRLDPSDTFVFPTAAEPGEWAIPGTFEFWDRDPAALTGRDKQAFRSGFLGLTTFGWSTLAVVVEATDDEHEAAARALAAHLVANHGAPDIETALQAAHDELTAAEDLARHPVQTLVALSRRAGDDGAIVEQFRTFAMADAKQATSMPCSVGAFAIVDADPEDSATSVETTNVPDIVRRAHDTAAADATIDLAAMIAGRAATGGGRV